MPNHEHLAILRKGVAAWNAWRDENPNIRPDLTEAELGSNDRTGRKMRTFTTGFDSSRARRAEWQMKDWHVHGGHLLR